MIHDNSDFGVISDELTSLISVVGLSELKQQKFIITLLA